MLSLESLVMYELLDKGLLKSTEVGVQGPMGVQGPLGVRPQTQEKNE